MSAPAVPPIPPPADELLERVSATAEKIQQSADEHGPEVAESYARLADRSREIEVGVRCRRNKIRKMQGLDTTWPGYLERRRKQR